MDPKLVESVAELIKAMAWGIGTVGVLLIGRRVLQQLLATGNPFSFSVGKFLAVSVEPSAKTTPPSAPVGGTDAALLMASADVAGAPTTGPIVPADDSPDLPQLPPDAPIPADYVYLV